MKAFGITSSSLLQIDLFIAKQFLFQRQWQKVREYARSKGVNIMGDMPIYVGYHSADVWANKKHFLLVSKSFKYEGKQCCCVQKESELDFPEGRFLKNLFAEQERLSASS